MSSATLKKKLAMAKKNFKNAKERAKTDGFGNEINDGKYRTKLIDARGPEESQNSGRLQFVMAFEITDGDYAGQKIYKYSGLESEDQMTYALRDIARFGIEIEDIEEIEEALETIAKAQPEVVITAKTKGDYQNFYINQVSDIDLEDEEEEEVEDEEEEEVEEEEEIEDEEEEEEEVPEDPEEEVEEEDEEDEDEEEEEEDDEEAIELEEGSHVKFTSKGKSLTGQITEIIDDEKVKVKSGTKTYRVSVNNLEPYTPPKKKAAKKVTKKAPAKKATKKKATKKRK